MVPGQQPQGARRVADDEVGRAVAVDVARPDHPVVVAAGHRAPVPTNGTNEPSELRKAEPGSCRGFQDPAPIWLKVRMSWER